MPRRLTVLLALTLATVTVAAPAHAGRKLGSEPVNAPTISAPATYDVERGSAWKAPETR